MYGAVDELLRMRLQMQHFVGRYRVQYTLEAGRVRAVQEELLPEAVGQLRVFIVLLGIC
jgi:hypothetical protein